MTTLPIYVPLLPPLAGLVSYFQIAIEVLTEAQRQAAAAHKRYPFAEW